ncbi:MAG: hypothetical protein ACT4NX_06240 [Deltaproteobacteria bacterium]
MIDKPGNDYSAVQIEDGFKIEFHNSIKEPIKVTFTDLQAFVEKINKSATTKKQIVLNDDEEVLLRLWQMLLIPEKVKH